MTHIQHQHNQKPAQLEVPQVVLRKSSHQGRQGRQGLFSSTTLGFKFYRPSKVRRSPRPAFPPALPVYPGSCAATSCNRELRPSFASQTRPNDAFHGTLSYLKRSCSPALLSLEVSSCRGSDALNLSLTHSNRAASICWSSREGSHSTGMSFSDKSSTPTGLGLRLSESPADSSDDHANDLSGQLRLQRGRKSCMGRSTE